MLRGHCPPSFEIGERADAANSPIPTGRGGSSPRADPGSPVARPSQQATELTLELIPRVLGMTLRIKQVDVGIPRRGGLGMPELAGDELHVAALGDED